MTAITRYRIAPRREVAAPRIRIAVLADLHACTPFMDEARIARIVDEVQALEADMICLLGDYAGHAWASKTLKPAQVAPLLARLTAPLGVHAVMGNHDWHDDPAAKRSRAASTIWHDALTEAGLPPLLNAARRMTVGGVAFTLAGLESQRAYSDDHGADDVAAALAGTDPGHFTILLAHEPDIFPTLPDQVDLTLSGHTHAGQIRLFGRPWVVPSHHGRRYAYGHHADGSKQLVVSAGVGNTGPPFRLFCPPELVLIEVG